jgi:hypothetical protein
MNGGLVLKRVRILICLAMLFSVGFSANASEGDKQVLIFKGESKHWTTFYKVTITGNTIDHIDMVKYKGKNIDSVGEVKYKLESIAGISEGTGKLAGNSKNVRAGLPGTIGGKGSGGNVELFSKVTTVLAYVEWNGKIERFELKKQLMINNKF